MESDGYSLDDKRTKINKNDVPDIVEKWKRRKEQKDSDFSSKVFNVDKKTIEDNAFDLSLNRYKSIDYKQTKYEDASVILNKIDLLEKEISSELNKLKRT